MIYMQQTIILCIYSCIYLLMHLCIAIFCIYLCLLIYTFIFWALLFNALIYLFNLWIFMHSLIYLCTNDITGYRSECTAFSCQNVKIYLQNIIALFLPFCLWGEVFFSLSFSFLFIYLFYCTFIYFGSFCGFHWAGNSLRSKRGNNVMKIKSWKLEDKACFCRLIIMLELK